MNLLYIESTDETPYVSFDPSKGTLELSGKSLLDDPDPFFNDLIEWVDLYISQPAKKTSFTINLESFNTSSLKQVLNLLLKLDELFKANNNVEALWIYNKDEDVMHELGQDYANMVKLPFQFIEKKPKLSVSI